MRPVIHTENLTKFYGKQRGVLDLDILVESGEVFGFLGPNGAGKTTTIRVLLDFIRPTRGRAVIFGLDAQEQSTEIRRRIGYLPGELELYEKLSGAELLRYFANLRGGVDWSYVEELAERFDCDLAKHIRSLSRGNKQKIGLIQAFMNKPELLILDEPTSGLDPLMQHEFAHLIGEVKSEGRAVFVSSHIMPEVEHICDHVGIIREGQLVAIEDIETLKGRAIRRLEIHFSSSVPPEPFANLPGVQDVLVADGILRCTVKGSLDAVIKAAAQFEVVNIISQEPSLEEIFLAYYGGGDHAA
ncbi:MAG: ABC transporter ATP-binding protein [Actinobacteria bacterium]|nr:ABC transporter ATP-binding protein [Actinomycetota bacterium]